MYMHAVDKTPPTKNFYQKAFNYENCNKTQIGYSPTTSGGPRSFVKQQRPPSLDFEPVLIESTQRRMVPKIIR